MPLASENMRPEFKMRVCVIGNSHVAAIKQGWDSLPPKQRGDFTFFASHSKTLNTLESIGGKLISRDKKVKNFLKRTSGGLGYIDVMSYDAFWLHGLTYDIPLLDKRLSSAVIDATLHDCIERSLNFKIAKMIRLMTEVPIVVSHSPLRVSAKPLPIEEYLSYEIVLARVASMFSQKWMYFPAQPAVTVDESGLATKHIYLNGSTNLRGQNTKVDNISHMNAEFGRCWIEHINNTIIQCK